MDLALFDFDGTVTDKETMPDFIYAAVSPGRLRLGKIILLPLILGYKVKLVSGSAIRAAMCFFGFWRVSADELKTQGQRFAKDFLPTRLRADAMERIAWHKARGDTVVIVSGGLDFYLSPWCKEHELDLLCSALEQGRNGKLSGLYKGKQCVGEEKARLVQQRFNLSQFSRIYAYGDTPEDRQLLALADEAYYRWQPSTSFLKQDTER